MTRYRRSVLFLLAGAGILVALLAGLALLAPRLVNTAAFRDFALAQIERRTGVRFSYAQAQVSLFFRPHVVVREAELEIQGVAQGKIEVIEANPDPIPLLLGRFRLKDLLLEGPDFRVLIPSRTKPSKAFSAEEFEGSLSSLLDALRRTVPVKVVTLRNGRLDLSDGEGPIVSLRDLDARVGLASRQVSLSVRCASRYWEGVSIESVLHREGLRGDATVEMEKFRVREFLERVAPGILPWLGDTEVSLHGKIESKGVRIGKAEFAGAVPALTLKRGTRSRAFQADSFRGSAEWGEGKLRGTLADLVIDDPGVRLSGELFGDPKAPSFKALLEGQDAKIQAIRTAILSLAADVPPVREALDVIRGGTLSRFSLKTEGKSPLDLANFAAMQARATLHGGTIVVPEVDLTLEEAAGEAFLSGGILTGRGLSARLGNSRAREGTLRMGVSGGDAPFHAEFLAVADLAQWKPLLRRLVPDEGVRREIDRIREVRGTASGRLTLGERLSAIRPTVALTDVDLAGTYDRVPFPIAIRGGQVLYDGDELSVTDLRGNLGGTFISGLTGRLRLGETPAVAVRGGTARIALEELYPWIASLERFREATKPVRSVRGAVEFADVSFDGPLRGPGEWRIEADGSVENLELNAPSLPGPVAIARGRFRVRPKEVSLTDAQASFLDTTCRGGLQLDGNWMGIRRVTASLQGVVGKEAADWAFSRLGIPHPYAPKAPFTVGGSKLSWEQGGEAIAEAELAWAGGPDLSLVFRKTPGATLVERLRIRDPSSEASASFHIDPETVKGRYSGTLSRSTLEKIVSIPLRQGARIRGEMEAVLDRREPARSSARGTLEGVDLVIPWKGLAPLVIRSLSLSADGRTVRVASSDLLWDDVPFSLTGTAELGAEAVVADLDVSAGDIDFVRWMRSIREESAGIPEADEPAVSEPGRDAAAISPKFPVRGALRLRADSVSHGSLTWRPVRAQADIGRDVHRFTLTEANLCGLSTPGTLTLDSSGAEVELAASADGEDFDATMTCLSGKSVSVTGRYGFSARVAGKGEHGEALVRSLEGPVELTLTDGRINRMTLFSRILAFLSVNELVRGRLPDLKEEGFPYRSLHVRGEMSDGKFLLEEAAMDAPSMGIAATGEVDLLSREADLEVLVSPFRTVDAVIARIPIFGYILAGTLVSIPVAVRGNLEDPTVRTMDPASVGKELLGIFERTLKVPARIISPVLPGDREGKGEGKTSP